MAMAIRRTQISSLLFTHEDQFNAHKILGGVSLLHFLYRFIHVGGESDMLFDGSVTTAACLSLHVLLSASSLMFKIPLRRIKDGSRLWPEARWHAILFATRHLACMTLLWYEQRYSVSRPMFIGNVVIVFLNLMAADTVNYVYRGSHSNYVRDMHTSSWVKYLFSHVQIGGTTYCLIGQRRYSFHFLAVFVIQFSAFMMTLRRKNLMSHSTWVGVYGCILIYGSVVAYIDLVQHSLWSMVVLCNISTVLRCVVGLNKYLLWACVSVLAILLRDKAAMFEENRYAWPVLIMTSYAVWIAGGVRYRQIRSGAWVESNIRNASAKCASPSGS